MQCDLPIASIGATVNDRGWCKTTALRFWGYSALATEIVCVLRYRPHHGPRTTLNLRALNLAMFLEAALDANASRAAVADATKRRYALSGLD